MSVTLPPRTPSSQPPAPAPLPTHRGCPFDPPGELGALREEEPVSRLAFPDGKTGWLLTRHEDVRAVLADDRFSSDRLRASSPVRRFPLLRSESPDLAGSLIGMDPPQHTRYRHLLTRHFTVRRMRELAPRIEQIVADHLDAMERGGPPTDLVADFARPIPSLVICELLGVPYEDRATFQRCTATLLRLDADEQTVRAARDELWAYMLGLVAAKRDHPDDTLLGTLIRDGDPDAPLGDAELAGLGRLLLVAGHETTANMLALGTYALLCHPEQLRALREDPELVDRAVEELLRYLTIVQFGTVRVAREDVEVGGRLIRAGETVVASLASANRDPEHFPDPDELDLARPPAQHVAFGHGIHQCLGQQLARVEMKIAYPALLRRFPALDLAVPPGRVPMRDDMFIYGVHRLPVTW
ncbi:cytochrome P450 [Peterkaempfera bronchialis]|uniref:Cytochrome P450 n=1 Tax=Peterkaempfera bronchialis TaxID=2126346 RepID=A0A345STZ6_9ACTN|nr:cytochrome P450 [Peterkaempfera bronchialis]AXI77201.1 cytochrome P450 [Peterkaempfera bronchialis]